MEEKFSANEHRYIAVELKEMTGKLAAMYRHAMRVYGPFSPQAHAAAHAVEGISRFREEMSLQAKLDLITVHPEALLDLDEMYREPVVA